MDDILKGIGTVVVYILLFVFFYSLIIALPVRILWNWIVPELFGLTKITYLQAFGISLLFRFLIPTSSNKSND